MKTAHILAGESEGERPFGRPRCKWKDCIIVWKQDMRMCAEFIRVGTGSAGGSQEMGNEIW
jgi:hypothetical protein